MTSSVESLRLVRLVANGKEHTVTIRGSGGEVTIEVGTDTAVVAIKFDDANLLRAIAGHLVAEADKLQQYHGAAYGHD